MGGLRDRVRRKSFCVVDPERVFGRDGRGGPELLGCLRVGFRGLGVEVVWRGGALLGEGICGTPGRGRFDL